MHMLHDVVESQVAVMKAKLALRMIQCFEHLRALQKGSP